MKLEGLCPVCDGELSKADIPRDDIYSCDSCKEILQVVGGEVSMLGSLLDRNALGDDRVHNALSRPTIANVASFIDVFENSTRMWQMDLASASGGLRTILAQIENRIDVAMSKFAGMDMASDDAADGLRMLREARELVSTLPSRNRGIQGGQNEHGKIRSEQQAGFAEAGTEGG